MRAFITFILIIAVLIGAAAIYLAVTTPREPVTLRFPLGGRHRAALALVPENAEAFAYLPRAAAFEGKVRRNPIARQILDSWTEHRPMPRPWMLGKADVIVFQAADRTRFLLRLDPVRATLVRLYLMVSGDPGETILINAPTGRAIGAEEIARIEALAARLPPGDAFVVQRATSRSAFPPIGRPAVSAVSIDDEDVVITSRAASQAPPTNLRTNLAPNALLSASFASPPRLISDLNRLLGAGVSDVFSDGGSVAIYDVDTGKLLPRPLGVIVVPANEQRRLTLAGLQQAGADVVPREDELVVSFDDHSLPLYLKEATVPVVVPGGKWAVRIDAQRIAPILDRLKDHVGLRIASGRTFRAVRNLREWIATLQEAKTIEATDTTDGQQEELKVRISTK